MTAESVVEHIKGYIDGTMVAIEDNMESPYMPNAQLDILKEIRELITKLERESDVWKTLKDMDRRLKAVDQKVRTMEMNFGYEKDLHSNLINLHAHHLDKIEEEVFGEVLELEPYPQREETEEECEA